MTERRCEPCPVTRIHEAEPGWLSILEVTPDRVARPAVAVYQPYTGLVRPSLVFTVWDCYCCGVPLVEHRTPDTSTWGRIIDQSVDHAYQGAASLAADTGLTLPGACLRLLVRVDL